MHVKVLEVSSILETSTAIRKVIHVMEISARGVGSDVLGYLVISNREYLGYRVISNNEFGVGMGQMTLTSNPLCKLILSTNSSA